MKNKTGIYKIINKVSGKFYIGSTAVCFHRRWSKHKSKLNTNKHSCRYLQSAWNKYGADAFEFTILLECLPQDCEMYEQIYLDRYWDGGVICYNSSRMSNHAHMLGRLQSKETRERNRQSKLGSKNPMYGKHHTNETRIKLRARVPVRGEHHGNAKLTTQNVKDIKAKYKSGGCTHRQLAAEYKVTRTAITHIINGKRWMLA